jgi:hypothetical protein
VEGDDELFGWMKNRDKGSQPAPQFPFLLQLIPERLSATVYLHDLDCGPEIISCWSYVSSGFSAVGQKEIVFTVKRGKAEPELPFPGEPLTFFEQIYPLACEGKLVDAGGYTGLGSTGFLSPAFGGILYQNSRLTIPGKELPLELLTALAVTPEEFAVAYKFGNLRVTALLADQCRFYPFPNWIDRKRNCVVSSALQQLMDSSPLAKVPWLRITGCRAIAKHNSLLIKISNQHVCHFQNVIEQISPLGSPFAVQLSLDILADCCLVWQAPGTASVRAVADHRRIAGSGAPDTESSKPEHARLGGAFLLFIAPVEKRHWSMLEDGFAVSLDESSWPEVSAALASGNDLIVSMADGQQTLEIRWDQGPSANKQGAVSIEKIRLLNTEQELSARVDFEEYTDYFMRVREISLNYLASGKLSPQQQLRLVCKVFPNKQVAFELLSDIDLDPQLQQDLYSLLEEITPPAVRDSQIGVEIFFAVS